VACPPPGTACTNLSSKAHAFPADNPTSIDDRAMMDAILTMGLQDGIAAPC
jgi:hypothetical protein